MPISNSYPSGIPIANADLFVGTKAYNNRTVNYTAQGVADYLNINSKVAIGGQMSFQFTIVPNIPKTIAFEGGFGNNTAFSAITKLIVSAIDLSTANITIFLNYLNNSQILLSEQNQPNFFGHYKITGYAQVGTSTFYELDLEFIGGNGTIIDKQYYDLVSFVLSTEVPATEWGSITGDIEDQTDLINYISSQITTPTLQEVTDEGNFTDKSIYVTDALGNYLVLGQEGSTPSLDFGLTIWDITTGADYSQYFIGRMTYHEDGNLYTYLMPDSSYPTGIGIKRLATTDDIVPQVNSDWNATSGVAEILNKPTIPTVGTWGALNYPSWSTGTPFVKMTEAGTFALDTNTYLTSAVTSVTATSPITSSGGATPVISTSMATNKLIGRSTAGTGVMEEITVGTGLTLSGGTLSSSVTGGIPHATASGTDTYTATVSGVTSYADADAYLIRFTNGNTTSATLNINSLGAIPLYRNNDGVLIGGDIISGGEMICVYNSTTNRFQVIGTAPNSLLAYVTNDDSVTLTKGMPVYAFGGTGDRMTVKRAFNTSDATSAQTVGLVLSTSIAANQKGLIMMQGLLDGLSILPTSTWSDGDAVYLGATAGTITNVKPFAPNHLVYLGVVTTASNGAAGRMYVRVQNGYELQELHNVQAQSPSLNNTLWYDNTVSPAQWKTASIPTILGFIPEDVANKQTDLTASATKYPTVNAVNTGLALKQNILSYTPYRNIQTSQTVHTGTTVETLIFTATIPAGAFSSTDVIKVLFGTNKSTALGTYSLRLRVNTTNTISGAPTIALYNGTATAQVNVMMRNFNLNGGNLYGFMFTTSGLTDITAQGGSLGSTTLNPANQFFIFATITLNNSGDSIIGNMFSIHN